MPRSTSETHTRSESRTIHVKLDHSKSESLKDASSQRMGLVNCAYHSTLNTVCAGGYRDKTNQTYMSAQSFSLRSAPSRFGKHSLKLNTYMRDV